MDEAGTALFEFEFRDEETDRFVVLAVPSEWSEWFGKASRKAADVFCLVPPEEERRKIVRREAESPNPDPLRHGRWPAPDMAAAPPEEVLLVVVVGEAVMVLSGWHNLSLRLDCPRQFCDNFTVARGKSRLLSRIRALSRRQLASRLRHLCQAHTHTSFQKRITNSEITVWRKYSKLTFIQNLLRKHKLSILRLLSYA